MRIMVLYFSGTGNTRRIGELLDSEFIAQSHESQIVPIEQITLGLRKPDWESCDLIGLGFPVHAMDAPQIIYDLLAQLPRARQEYFLFKTAGSAFLRGGSTLRIREILANLGWRLRHEQLYVMPSNVFGPSGPDKVSRRYNNCRELAIQSALEIISGMKRRVPEASFRAACYSFAALEKRGAEQSSKHWTVNADCTLCGLCAAQCPTANISIEAGKLVFSNQCLLCLRCWWNCPTRALSHRILGPFFLKKPYKLPQ